MKSITQRSIPVSGIIIGACALVALLFGVVVVSRVQAAANLPKNGQRLITIHDGTQDKGIVTRATTLRQVFKEANIGFDERDRVEPGIDEELVANNYEVNIYRARPVIVVDGTIRQKIMTPYRTPRQIANDAKITLQDEDITSLSANSNMVSEGAGVQLSIKRATPFTFIFYGTKSTNYTQSKTVADMLRQKNITLGKDDTLSVPLTATIYAGMTIELWRNGIQTATAEEAIPFATEKVQSADHPIGYRQLQTPGIPGKKTVTYEIEMKNGKEVSRKAIQSITTKEPIKQVEIVGAKLTNTFNGSFAEALARLRSCEGSYTSNTGNGYYGAYQFDRQTWGNYGGYAVASDAPPGVQDEKAWLTYQRRGWQPWPSCSRSMGLQDIYR